MIIYMVECKKTTVWQLKTPLKRLGQKASNGVSRKSKVIIQKLTAPPSPRRLDRKEVYFTHPVFTKITPFPHVPPSAHGPLHRVPRRMMNAAKLITFKQEMSDRIPEPCHPIHPHDFPFHSFQQHPKNHSGCRLFQQPQERQTQPQVKDRVQTLFSPSGKGKSWCNGPAGDVWHRGGGHLDYSHGTTVEIPSAQAEKCLWLGKERYPISRLAQGNTWRQHLRASCQNPPLAESRTAGARHLQEEGASPEGPTMRRPPLQLRLVAGLSQRCSRDRGSGYTATPRLAPCAHLRVRGQARPPRPQHLGSTHHEEPAEKQTNVLCATTVLFSTQFISLLSITH